MDLQDLAQQSDHVDLALHRAVVLADQGRCNQALQAAAVAIEGSPSRQILARRLTSASNSARFRNLSRATAFALDPEAQSISAILRRSLATGTPAPSNVSNVGTGASATTGASPANQAPASQAPAKTLFSCPLQLNGRTQTLAFTASSLEPYKRQKPSKPTEPTALANASQRADTSDSNDRAQPGEQGERNAPDNPNAANQLHYQLAPNTAGYLVSNDSGNFDHPPVHNGIALRPNTAYQLTALLHNEGGSPPVIWVFDYSATGKVEKHSYPTEHGQVNAFFQTSPKHASLALGIRLSGEGQLHIGETAFRLRSGADIDSAYRDDQLNQRFQSAEAKLAQQLSKRQDKLQEQQRKHTLAQLEDFVRLQTFMGADIVLPEMHGWPISPDVGMLLIRLLEAQAYDAVIEFGSGVSTLILAQAIRKTAARHQRPPARFLSVEHLEPYRDQTAAQLQQAGLQDQVDLCLAPLEPYQVENGETYPYYSIQAPLQQLARQLGKAPRLLVLVDGPPGATRPQARYPALPLLLEAFPNSAQFDILMDDYIRDDERAILAHWEADLSQRGRPHQKQEYTKLEKQACLLQVGPQSEPPPA